MTVTFTDLPDVVLKKVAGFLRPHNLLYLDAVSEQWRGVLRRGDGKDDVWGEHLPYVCAGAEELLRWQEDDRFPSNRLRVCTKLALDLVEREQERTDSVFDVLNSRGGNKISRADGFMRIFGSAGSVLHLFFFNHYYLRGDTMATLAWLIERNAIEILKRSFAIKCRVAEALGVYPEFGKNDIEFCLRSIYEDNLLTVSSELFEGGVASSMDSNPFNELQDRIVMKLCRRAGIVLFRKNEGANINDPEGPSRTMFCAYVWKFLVARVAQVILTQFHSAKVEYGTQVVQLQQPYTVSMRRQNPPWGIPRIVDRYVIVPRNIELCAKALKLPIHAVHTNDWFPETVSVPGQSTDDKIAENERQAAMGAYTWTSDNERIDTDSDMTFWDSSHDDDMSESEWSGRDDAEDDV